MAGKVASVAAAAIANHGKASMDVSVGLTW
jgi:hypothetical protein